MSLRKTFADLLTAEMKKNKNVVLVTGDLGYGFFDEIKKKYPRQYINVGAAEQSLLGVACGLALEGKVVFAYSITSFLLYRPFETIRNYVNHECIPVKLIGSGRDKDYAHDGISHWCEEDRDVMALFKNIRSYWPTTPVALKRNFTQAIQTSQPFYINLSR